MVIAVGLMTGSSMDGIDAAIIDTDGQKKIEFLEGASLDFSLGFKKLLRATEYAVQKEQGIMSRVEHYFEQHMADYVSRFLSHEPTIFNDWLSELNISSIHELHYQTVEHYLTQLHAHLVQQLLQKTGMSTEQVDVVGFHGQTWYHNPEKQLSLQGGDGQLLANLLKIPVIHNFRENDIKHGGNGAPFAPLYHQALALHKGYYPIAFVNCGGIANITVVSGREHDQLLAFDVGPGNVLVDRYIRLHTRGQEWMDTDGHYGKNGQVNPEVLALLKKKSIVTGRGDFLKESPPKSLDARHFSLIEELEALTFEDACATLEAFTAHCIVDSLDFIQGDWPKLWVLSGGGWKNPVILGDFKNFLSEKLGEEAKILSADDLGWNSQYMEAEIFAYLAVRSLYTLPLSYPGTTGVSKPVSGGVCYQPSLL